MYQFYVVEIQQYANGTFGHLVHYAYDEDADVARRKGEAKYYEVLSAAALSEIPQHAAILFNAEGFPIMHQCYHKTISPPEQEQVEDEP